MSSFLALGLFGKVEPMLCGSNSNFPTTFAEIKFFMGRNRIIRIIIPPGRRKAIIGIIIQLQYGKEYYYHIYHVLSIYRSRI